MNGIRKWIGLGLWMLVACAFAQTSPVPMLDSAANHIISTLKENKTALKQNHQLIHQAVQQYLLPIVDINGMARSVLGRQAWMRATAAEKQAFTQAFTQLVIRTYATPLAQYTDEQIKFLPVRGSLDAKFVRVNSVIKRSNGQDIPLAYSLVAKGDQWRIYDLSVEGVSLLQSFRTQFAQALQHESITKLIDEMHQKKVAAS